MTREEACLIGFSIIKTSGLAKNELFAALEAANSGNYLQAQSFIDRANSLISRSRSIQEAFRSRAGNQPDTNVILCHGQNALETTQVFHDYVLDLTKVSKSSLFLPSIYHHYC